MKRILLTLFAVAALSLFVAAQSDSQPPQSETQHHHAKGEHMSPQARLDRMSQKLSLTDDQKEKILPILQDESQKAQALRADTSMSEQDKRSKFRQMHQDTMSQIRPLLTQEQQQKLDAMANEREKHGRSQSKSE